MTNYDDEGRAIERLAGGCVRFELPTELLTELAKDEERAMGLGRIDSGQSVQETVERLAWSGIMTSFCFGLCGGLGRLWTVDVLTDAGKSFERPYGAHTLRQAAEIALHECEKRGWCNCLEKEPK